MEAYNRIYPLAFFVLLIFTFGAYSCASTSLLRATPVPRAKAALENA